MGEHCERIWWLLIAPQKWLSWCILCVLCLVAQSCPTLCDPMDCSLPGSSVHGDSPGKNTGVGCNAFLQWIYPTQVSRIVGGFFTVWATRETQEYWNGYPIPFLVELPGPGIELGSPALQADSLPAALPGKLHFMCILPQLKWKKKILFDVLGGWFNEDQQDGKRPAGKFCKSGKR